MRRSEKAAGESRRNGHPIGDAANQVPFIVDGEGKLGALWIEEQLRHLEVPSGKAARTPL